MLKKKKRHLPSKIFYCLKMFHFQVGKENEKFQSTISTVLKNVFREDGFPIYTCLILETPSPKLAGDSVRELPPTTADEDSILRQAI